MNAIIKYFDLASRYRPSDDQAISDEQKLHWLPQYLALLAGIVAQPYFQHYMEHGNWNFSGFSGWLFASIFIAIMAFPAVYKNSFDATKPIIVQLCVLFTVGTGWQTIVSTATLNQ